MKMMKDLASQHGIKIKMMIATTGMLNLVLGCLVLPGLAAWQRSRSKMDSLANKHDGMDVLT